MIEVVNLYKKFDGQEVLKGINLKIEEGKISALIGGSGNGKSVLLKHIIGLLKPDSGKVVIDDQDISNLKGKALVKLKERLGIVFQGGALFDSMTVFENISFPLKEKTDLTETEIKKKVLRALASVELKDTEEKYPMQLSGGMKKRVALARCMALNPEIILFDEPTTGLDPLITKSIHKLIRSIQEERKLTALIVTHQIPEIFNIVDQVAMLHDGKIQSVGTPNQITNSKDPIIQQFLRGEIE